MLTLPARIEHGLTVVVGLSHQQPVLEVIARLALHGRVQVVVGGNRFDAHRLARIIRRHTIQLDQTLARIHQARPFTCFQALKLLAETQPVTPLVAIDVLTTFYDENISDAESVRLVSLAVAQLQRLSEQAPVLVTVRPAAVPARAGLIKIVQRAASQLYIYEFPDKTVQPPLF